MADDSTPEDLFRRTHLGIARLRESQRQLVRDIQERYNELGMAVDQLRSYFSSSSESSNDEENFSTENARHTVQNRRDGQRTRCKRKNTKTESSLPIVPKTTLQFIQDRQFGYKSRSHHALRNRQFVTKDLPDYVSQNLPGILSEKELDLGSINKVFASQWLNNSQVVLGTKCNKLMVMDVSTNDMFTIPNLKSSKHSDAADCPCGIHAISINPSRTLLATGGQNTNDLAVYELPAFEPLCVGEGAHKDWIFDLDFIDDQHIITGSRDSTVALWRLPDNLSSYTMTTRRSAAMSAAMGHAVISPVQVQTCKYALRVRALSLGRDKRIMGVLSMDAKFHFWDLERFKQLDTLNLPLKRENVCVASSDELGLFAVGSESYVTLLDHRKPGRKTSQKPKSISVPHRYRNSTERLVSWPSKGIRSLSFNEKIITVGTGDGRLLFFDLRNEDFLQLEEGRHLELCVGDGWLRNDSNYRDHFLHGHYPNAIYTHCYDQSRGRIFTAGGPLPAGLYGNYAGMFY